MVNSNYEYLTRSASLNNTQLTRAKNNLAVSSDNKLDQTSDQRSYWKFLAEKLPLETDIQSPGCPTSIQEEECESEDFSPQQTFAQKIQSIDAVLHIVSDNHKSHEILQRRHSVPPSPNYLKSSVSAPALAKKMSASRWGTATPQLNANVAKTLKTPKRYNPSTTPSPSNEMVNATWSERPHSSSQLPRQRNFASADQSRLQSLGLSELRGSKPQPRKLEPPDTSAANTTRCRWSIPSNNSDSLLIYPQRGREQAS
jgi:hypothetical protein